MLLRLPQRPLLLQQLEAVQDQVQTWQHLTPGACLVVPNSKGVASSSRGAGPIPSGHPRSRAPR